MSLKKLFLSHFNRDAVEVGQLALELRLRGIVPWVDKDSGFQVADESVAEARRAIREDCFGMLLYATKQAFDRWFIREVEIDEALKVRQVNPEFDLFAVPRRIGFSKLREYSQRSFGIDLSAFHTLRIASSADRDAVFTKVACGVLEKVLRRAAGGSPGNSLSLQFSTRELMPDEPEDVLCINATAPFSFGLTDQMEWDRLLRGLRDVKSLITGTWGRPRLAVNGSKHLSSAFAFGRVFAPFELDIRQTADQVWPTDISPASAMPFAASVEKGEPNDGRLFVEVASGYKNVSAGVDSLLDANRTGNPVRLKLRPLGKPVNVDAPLCRAMADQAYSEIERALQSNSIREIHLFAAAPQSFMLMLGRAFKGTPPVHLYEWSGSQYVHCCYVPPGVF